MDKYLIILGCLMALTFYRCSGEKEDDLIDTLEKEKIAIHDYLRANVTSPILTVEYYSRKGMLIDTIFIYNYDGSGEVSADTGWVLMNYDRLTLDGRVEDTTDPSLIDSILVNQITYRYGGPVLHRLDTAKKYDFVADVLRRARVGGTGAEVIIPSILSGTKDGKTQRYRLKSHKIIADVFKNEVALIQNSLGGFGTILETILNPMIPKESPDPLTDTITYTLITERGVDGEVKNEAIQEGATLVLQVNDCILDDVYLQDGKYRSFETHRDSLVFAEKWWKTVPVGYRRGLLNLKQGDKAKIIVPYGMAYGAVGKTHEVGFKDQKKKQFLIPPFTTLMYEVEVIKVVLPPVTPLEGKK